MVGDDIQEWWKLEEHERVVALIREVGAWRLGNFDGCVCCHFKVRNVDVEIGCGKGGDRGIWVSSPSLDYYNQDDKKGDEAMLRPIAEEVQRQIEGRDMRGPIPINLCERNAQ